MGIHIVLYQPEVPSNTGNIVRTCAGTNANLHLIRPLGFSTEDKMLKRAGLDYWEHVAIQYYDSFDEFVGKNKNGELFFITELGQKQHSSFDYSDSSKDYFFIFGSETKGLPKEVIEQNMDRCVRLPMTEKTSGLNLSNTAAILIYEALRQQHFHGLTI